jgi:hypothetical protein
MRASECKALSSLARHSFFLNSQKTTDDNVTPNVMMRGQMTGLWLPTVSQSIMKENKAQIQWKSSLGTDSTILSIYIL